MTGFGFERLLSKVAASLVLALEVVEEPLVVEQVLETSSVSLFPDVEFGNINFEDEYVGVATGGGDRAISSVSNASTGSSETLADLGTEGSYASWDNLENGIYEVTNVAL